MQLSNVTVSAFHPFTFTRNSSVVITGSVISGNPGRGDAKCALDSLCTLDRTSIQANSVGCFGGDLEEEVGSSVNIESSENVSIESLGPFCTSATVSNSKISTLADASAKQTVLTNNIITENFELGLWDSFTISGNVFSGSTNRGIQVFSGAGVISGNQFIGSFGDGVRVLADGLVGPLEISDNEFDSNGVGRDAESGLDGLSVLGTGAGSVIVVSRNHTRNHPQYGINAEPGTVTDGGGNTSAEPLRCRGVVCAPG